MARKQPNRLLTALLDEADWNRAELARAVNDLGAAQGLPLRYDRTSVAHWLTGSRPRAPVPDLVAAAFSRRSGRLVTAEETGLARPPQTTGESFPGPLSVAGHVGDRLAALSRADTDPVRRAQLTGSVYELAAEAPFWHPGRRPAPRKGVGPQATSGDLERLHRMIRVFADLMERHGGDHARSALAAYLAEDISRLLTTSAVPSLRRELFAGAGQLTHLQARMSMDAGHHSVAQRYFTTALDLAREADDRRLFAITLRAMSLQALFLGFGEHAGQLSGAAVDTAGSGTDAATRAFLLSQRALTHAHARQPHRAVRDLTAAEAEHDRATSPAGPFTGYPRAGLDYQRARVCLALGDTAEAVRALTASADDRADDRHRSSALTRARLAETLLSVGHLDESCVHWHIFLDHYPSLRSAPADQAHRRLRTSLRGFRRQPQAAAVIHRARAFPPRRAAR
ncbi:tol-pal system YbgF family protein [Streptomyces sp. NPDC057307]|uniref:tetratricopeptide repeat protein n=1 Tax=Streptomyces sp. NPDC057307 TaxID=3346096 RepID=UPI0036263956